MRRDAFLAAALLAVGLLACAAVEAVGWAGTWREASSAASIGGSELPRWRGVRLLCEMGLLKPGLAEARDRGEDNLSGSGSVVRYSLASPGRQLLPSTEAARNGGFLSRTKLPVLSIYARDDDLYSPSRGILVNRLKRGRAWERPVAVSLLRNGRPVLEVLAGLRVAGDKSRIPEGIKRSLRLFFRKEYGRAQAPASALVGGTGEISGLTLDRWEFFGLRFGRPIAHEVLRRAGVLAPRSRACLLLLNGKPLGIYGMTGDIDADFCRPRWGHTDFNVAHYEPTNVVLGPSKEFMDLWRSLFPLSFAERADVSGVQRSLDTDSIYRWAACVNFLAATDAQPYLLRDRARPGAKWFPVAWDVDHAFLARILVGAAGLKDPAEANMFIKPRCGDRLAWPLLIHSADNRSAFARVYRSLLAKELSTEALLPIIDEWERRMAPEIGLECEARGDLTPEGFHESMERLRDFVRRRPQIVSRQLEEFLASYGK